MVAALRVVSTVRQRKKRKMRTRKRASSTTSVTLLSSSFPSSNSTSAAHSLTHPGICIHPLPTPDATDGKLRLGILNEIVVAVTLLAYRCSILRKVARSLASSYVTSSSVRSSSTNGSSTSYNASPTKQTRVLISSTSSSDSSSRGIFVRADAAVELSVEGGGTNEPNWRRRARRREVMRAPATGVERRSGKRGREEKIYTSGLVRRQLEGGRDERGGRWFRGSRSRGRGQ